MRSLKLRPCEELFSTIVVKPPLARLEACDYRVTRSGAMFRCMLIWRAITAANVTTFGASAKMEPPSPHSRAFGATCSTWLGRRIDTVPLGFHGLLPESLLLQLGATPSLQRFEPIHHSRNKLRHCGMNMHRALYHCVGRLGIHDIEHAVVRFGMVDLQSPHVQTNLPLGAKMPRSRLKALSSSVDKHRAWSAVWRSKDSAPMKPSGQRTILRDHVSPELRGHHSAFMRRAV